MTNTKMKLRDKLRLLEIELTNKSAELYRVRKAFDELDEAVEFLREQIIMVKSQIERCSNG